MTLVNPETGERVASLLGSLFAEAEASLVSDAELFAGLDQRVIAKLRNGLGDGSIARSTLASAAKMRAANSGRPARRAPSRVYFIKAETTGLIKIGCAVDPEARLRTLQTGCPDRLALLASMAGGQGDERALHERFASARIRGEWFSPREELVRFVEEIAR